MSVFCTKPLADDLPVQIEGNVGREIFFGETLYFASIVARAKVSTDRSSLIKQNDDVDSSAGSCGV